jgi:hypothetical protein
MKYSFKLFSSLLLLVLFHICFWHEYIGINLPLFFTAVVVLLVFINYKSIILSKELIIFIILCLASGGAVIIYNTSLSIVSFCISVLALIGFLKNKYITAVYISIMSAILSIIASINYIWRSYFFKTIKNNAIVRQGAIRFPVLVIPFLVTITFFAIYFAASNFFNDASSVLINYLFEKLAQFYLGLSFSWLAFIISGFLLIYGLVGNYLKSYFTSIQQSKSIELIRQKFSLKIWNKHPYASLKNEIAIAFSMLILLNVMLLFVNYLDIVKLWFGFKVPINFDLKQFVHEGTYLLIISILMAIIVLLYLFRKNLNFYSNNSKIKLLAYFWIVQNIILSISVGFRNIYYINFHGLAYKRIGVIVFLICTITVLITLIIKIKKRYSVYYLLKTNSLLIAIYICFTVCICNWENFVINFNIHHWNSSQIDTDFYFKTSANALPLLMNNKLNISNQLTAHKQNNVRWSGNYTIEQLDERIAFLQQKTKEKIANSTIMSWNYIEYKKLNSYLK